MDPDKVNQFKQRMNTLAYGEAMLAAARDYGAELLDKERAAAAAPKHAAVDVEELLDDADLHELHEARIAELRAARERRAAMSRAGHGELTDIVEGDFLSTVTQTRLVVAHFYHNDFERCRIMDRHLRALAPVYFETRFVRLHAPDAPFFIAKLNIQMLPCLVLFVQGVAIDRVVGFDELGGRDDFATAALEARMRGAGAIGARTSGPDGEDEAAEGELHRVAVRKGFAARVADDDEDSDFG